jgi:hypothetical protein
LSLFALLSAGVALAATLATLAAVRRSSAVKDADPARTACTHLDKVADVVPSARGCEECLRLGDHWVHLRLCLS